MTDYPTGEQEQHLYFNRVVRESAELARRRQQQLFRERFHAVMGYWPEINSPPVERNSLLATRNYYRVGQYLLAAVEDEGIPYLILDGHTRWFASPAEFEDYIEEYDNGIF